MFWGPEPIDPFSRKGIERFGDGGKSPDKCAIKVAKTQKRTNVLDLVWRGPVFDRRDFNGVHACHPLFKDYPQVIDARGMENAFFRFEVQVVFYSQL